MRECSEGEIVKYSLHQLLQRQQQLALVGEQQIDVWPREFYRNIGILKIRMRRLVIGDFVIEAKSTFVTNQVQEGFDLAANFGYRIFLFTHGLFPRPFLTGCFQHFHARRRRDAVENHLLRDADHVAGKPVQHKSARNSIEEES